MDPNYVRDEENEDAIMQQIYDDANPIDPDGEDAGGEDVGGGTDAGGEDDDFSSQFLNDSGEGVELEDICRAEEVPLTNSGEVYILSLC